MAASEIEKLERLVKENPKGRLFASLADAYRKDGQYPKALEVLEAGLKNHPDYVSARVVLGRVQMAIGDKVQARTELERLLARGVDHSDAILCRGLLAKAHDRAGDRRSALAHARHATALIDKLPPASFHTLLGNAAVAELRLAQWQLQSSPALRAEARHAIRGLWLFTLACPIGRPWLWRARAEFARLDGRPARAQRCLARAQAEAARLGMRVRVEGVRG